MKDLSIIIPLNEFNDTVEELLPIAIKSVPEENHIYISTIENLVTQITEFIEKLNLSDKITIVCDKKGGEISDFCTLVNTAVNIIDEKWFSILEFDDVYTNIWFVEFEKYLKEHEDVSLFLPMVDLIDYEQKKFIGFNNEVAWANSFSNELGFIDNDCLQEYFDFNVTGGIFDTDSWDEVGGLKPSIKLSFWYEFMLRMTNSDKKIYVIPKVGYQHFLGRPNSLLDKVNKEMTEDEGKFWIDTAKKEYKNKENKKIVYKIKK
jgi:hypothetical protein